MHFYAITASKQTILLKKFVIASPTIQNTDLKTVNLYLPCGEALYNAKYKYASQHSTTDRRLKTLYVFNLYGDPSLGLEAKTFSPPTTVYVDDDYNYYTDGWGYDHFASIQDAVNAVDNGGVVFVYSGTYHENIIVEKSVKIIGENKDTTIVVGKNNSTAVFTIKAPYVNITGLTIKNGAEGLRLYLIDSYYNIFNNTICENSLDGIYLIGTNGGGEFIISDNNICNNSRVGIHLENINAFYDCYIQFNKIYNNAYDGIFAEDCNYIFIDRNIICRNGHAGIVLKNSQWDRVVTNEICLNEYDGILLRNASNNFISEGNRIYENGHSGIFLINASYNHIENDNKIYNNTDYGIRLLNASKNEIQGCCIYKNRIYGICLYSSKSNSIYANRVYSNKKGGINITRSVDNNISGNFVKYNGIGIFCDNSTHNLIYNNYFNNTNNAYDNGNNKWNISRAKGTNIIGGSYLGGNYWSDYKGCDIDGDGLGDTMIPYNNSGEIQNGGDYHPLTSENDITPPVTVCTISGTMGSNGWYISDVTISLCGEDFSKVTTYYKINGGGWQIYNRPITLTNNGVYTFSYYSIDDAGNAEQIKTEIIKIDKIDPQTYIFLRGNQKNNWFTSDVWITLKGKDDHSGMDHIMYRVNGKMWTVYGGAFCVSNEGFNTIEYYSIDKAGHVEPTKSISFGIDKSAPKVEVIYPNGGEVVSGKINIKWEAKDVSSLFISIYYSNNNGATWHSIVNNYGNTGKYEWDTTGLQDGEYLIKVVAEDAVGNTAIDLSDSTFIIYNNKLDIDIVKPKKGYLYVFDKEVIPLIQDRTVIIGKITITASIKSGLKIEKVEFYIDDELEYTVYKEPFEWVWNEPVIGEHTIKVTAYNSVESLSSECRVLVLNL